MSLETTALLLEVTVAEEGKDAPVVAQGRPLEEGGGGTRGAVADLLRLALPIALSYFGLFSLTFVAQVFVRHYDVPKVAGYGLATMVINFVGLAPITGISLGLDVLLPQAYGLDPKHPAIGVMVQRAVLVLFAWCAPVAVLLLFAEPILLAVGAGNADAVREAGLQLRVMIPVLPMWCLSEVLQCYLGGVNQVVEMVVGTLIAAVLNPVLLYFVLGWIGYPGVGCVIAADVAVMFSAMLLCAAYTGSLYDTWGGFSWKAFAGWWEFLKIALPCLGMMLCEWSGQELNSISAVHFLSEAEFTAVAICSQLVWICVPVPLAFAVATGIKVGNAVGAGNVPAAHRAAYIGAAATALVLVVDGAVLFGCRGVLGSLFTQDAVVQAAVAETLPSMILFHFFDSSLSFLCGVIRAVGHQIPGAALTFVSWWVFAVPLSWLLVTQAPHLGPRAFYLGPSVGLCLGASLGALYVAKRVSWETSSEVAKLLSS